MGANFLHPTVTVITILLSHSLFFSLAISQIFKFWRVFTPRSSTFSFVHNSSMVWFTHFSSHEHIKMKQISSLNSCRYNHLKLSRQPWIPATSITLLFTPDLFPLISKYPIMLLYPVRNYASHLIPLSWLFPSATASLLSLRNTTEQFNFDEVQSRPRRATAYSNN